MYNINQTAPNIIRYPLHSHQQYEIMVYLNGNGYLKTADKNYTFSPGTVIIVPPSKEHGSVSENGFTNISIEGDFENVLNNKNIVSFCDNQNSEITTLAKLIYNNRFKDKSFLASLCSAFIKLLLIETDIKSNIHSAVNTIVLKLSEQYYDSELDIRQILKSTGYAEDYIRSEFKKITHKTPTAFLNDVRIMQAAFLIDIYRGTLSLTEIAEKCGFNDYVYFSKKFKTIYNMSPSRYKKRR